MPRTHRLAELAGRAGGHLLPVRVSPWTRSHRAVRDRARQLRDGVDSFRARRLAEAVLGPAAGWEITWARRARNGTWSALAAGPGQNRPVVIKLAASQSARSLLKREFEVLRAVRTALADHDLLHLVPEPLDIGAKGNNLYVIQTALRGTSAERMLAGDGPQAGFLAMASATIRELHRATATERLATSAELNEWVTRPIGLVARLRPGSEAALGALREELLAALSGRVGLGVVHGDYWPANVLLDGGRVSGIVDWDSGALADLPLHDQLHLVLYTRKMLGRTPLGPQIGRALRPDPAWAPDELQAVSAATMGGPPLRKAILLYWLRVIQVNFARQPAVTGGPRWVRENISTVLECL